MTRPKISYSNNNTTPCPFSSSLADFVFFIVKHSKSTSQSGFLNGGKYKLIAIKNNDINLKTNQLNIMNWLSSKSTSIQVNYAFNNLKSAILYCTSNNLKYKIAEDNSEKSSKIITKKSYTDNFTL